MSEQDPKTHHGLADEVRMLRQRVEILSKTVNDIVQALHIQKRSQGHLSRDTRHEPSSGSPAMYGLLEPNDA